MTELQASLFASRFLQSRHQRSVWCPRVAGSTLGDSTKCPARVAGVGDYPALEAVTSIAWVIPRDAVRGADQSEFAIRLLNRHIVDAHLAARHQTVVVEFPQFIAITAEPVPELSRAIRIRTSRRCDPRSRPTTALLSDSPVRGSHWRARKLIILIPPAQKLAAASAASTNVGCTPESHAPDRASEFHTSSARRTLRTAVASEKGGAIVGRSTSDIGVPSYHPLCDPHATFL